MSLPPALLARLAQRGLVEKNAVAESDQKTGPPVVSENEEVIAENYDDEIDGDDIHDAEEYQNPSQYEDMVDYGRKRNEDSYWLESMKQRMSDVNSITGHKGCPNKYNIWHKCTLFCVNRWSDGKLEPSRDYMRRFKRLIRKYPLPEGWTKLYDAGVGCYYFCCANDNLVSWLPPTHPKSNVSKCAATLRRQLEDSAGGDGLSESDENSSDYSDDDRLPSLSRHRRDSRDGKRSSRRSRSPISFSSRDFPSLHESQNSPSPPSKQKLRKN